LDARKWREGQAQTTPLGKLEGLEGFCSPACLLPLMPRKSFRDFEASVRICNLTK
jgi:hypothetical protein